ncbi:MAG: hypothetical protein GC166_12050 [Alphaproteobacteria bacterium]|nr:hypothetical protein [Alphaproteobacteria bacterium]
MKRRVRTAEGSVEIDEVVLRWSLIREPHYTPAEGHKGMVFSVKADGPRAFRELVLEFPYPGKKPTGFVKALEVPPIEPSEVEAGIREALAAGWDPVSRGRVFIYEVEGKEG